MKKYLFILLISLIYTSCADIRIVIEQLDKKRVISEADRYLSEAPVTITSFTAERSSGGIHDYFSEGDYWWPDPEDPDGPYIRRDGLTNPENFNAHREALRRFSIQAAVLTAAYRFTGDIKYAHHAIRHLEAWFCNEKTLMNPNLRYAQAIKGVTAGRGIGIIDTIHLVEIVQAVMYLESMGIVDEKTIQLIKEWFRRYNEWLVNDQFGIDERDNGNNHSTCWNMQVAQYAKFTGDEKTLEFCRNHFRIELLPDQLAADGSFPLELKRTKPYGYSLFNLDAMIVTAEILSTDKDNLWEATTKDGSNLKTAMEFLYPYIKDKSTWPYPKDVMYFDDWPVRHPSLLFAGLAYNEQKYIELWRELNPSPQADEVLRNFFIRQPILWFE